MRGKLIALTLFISLSLVQILCAKNVVLGIGGRAGATLDPDQGHLGIQADLGELAERLRLQPNIELGLGSDQTIVALNPEVVYLFSKRDKWTPYAGGGLGLNIVHFDKASPGGNKTDLEVGLNLLGGLETIVTTRTRLFFEGKVGIGDSPELKVTCGFTILR